MTLEWDQYLFNVQNSIANNFFNPRNLLSLITESISNIFQIFLLNLDNFNCFLKIFSTIRYSHSFLSISRLQLIFSELRRSNTSNEAMRRRRRSFNIKIIVLSHSHLCNAAIFTISLNILALPIRCETHELRIYWKLPLSSCCIAKCSFHALNVHFSSHSRVLNELFGS